jgi:hypothetical protein
MKTLRRLAGPSLFRKIMRGTFYGHFVAGECLDEVVIVFANVILFFCFQI